MLKDLGIFPAFCPAPSSSLSQESKHQTMDTERFPPLAKMYFFLKTTSKIVFPSKWMAQDSDAGAGSLAGKPWLNHPSAHRYQEQLSPRRPNLHLRQTQYVPAGQCHRPTLSLPMSPPMLDPSASPSSSTFCFFCCQNTTQSHNAIFLHRIPSSFRIITSPAD